MPARILTCKVCSEEFELLPGKPGFANVCPECSAPKVHSEPYHQEPKTHSNPRHHSFRRPMSPEAASRAIDRALDDMAHLLSAIDPQFRSNVEKLTGRRFNRYITALGAVAKEGRQ